MPYASSPPSSSIAFNATGGDDAPALQALFDSLAGVNNQNKEIIIKGLCNISTGLTLLGSGIRIRGANLLSGFKAMAGAEGITMLRVGNSAVGGVYPQHVEIDGLYFTSVNQKTAGYGISMDSVGNSFVRNCNLWNQYNGIAHINGSNTVEYWSNGIWGHTNHAFYVDVAGETGIGNVGYGTEPTIISNHTYGLSNLIPGGLCTGASLCINRCDAVKIHHNSFLAAKRGLLWAPNVNHDPQSGAGFITGNFFDTHEIGMELDGTGQLAKLFINNNWFGYCSKQGIKLSGAQLRGIFITQCMIEANGFGSESGITLAAGPTDVVIKDSVIGGNGGSGISIAAGATDFTITGNRIDNTVMGGGIVAGTQQYGISYGGSHNNYIVSMNNLRGNNTAATNGTPGGSNFVNTNNIT